MIHVHIDVFNHIIIIIKATFQGHPTGIITSLGEREPEDREQRKRENERERESLY